ncbi:flagellar biosynthetic protein FliR [Sphingomonas arenae]|uniref:flagellar biosynthetic protein FliR n=1 Tax=Sphingomonas arenae TaxID=2812555 RepID=UPI0019671EB2|nr:flagellar biosynthetic protein FliR [Sphingomonas arenae]
MTAALFAEFPLYATTFLLLFARVGSVLMLLPVFSEEAVPGYVRLLLALGLTLALCGLLGSNVLPHARDERALLGLLLIELLVGLSLGMLVKLFFQAIGMAGSLVSMQVGLSSALLFDPGLGGQVPVLAKLCALAAALVCLGLGIHHLWIAAIVRSYSVFPVGAMPTLGDLAQLAIATVGKSFALAVSLAGPFLVYGFLFNLALGFSSRLAPAIQVFFIAQPLNLLLGLALFAGTVGGMLSLFGDQFALWLQDGWTRV